MYNKFIIVINGKGGVGKDTLCSFVAEKHRVMNISAITPVKEMAKIIGWNGEKDNNSRKLLSDLKMIAISYNDFPNVYLLAECERFIKSEDEILFVHIREKQQIEHFISSVSHPVTTLLVRRFEESVIYGNRSDDEVELYNYDYVYNNDKGLSEAKVDFMQFFDNVLKKIEEQNKYV